jgi:lipopolysaccharide/colanic/teichoic acid biosynthesis glycosyltransferase
MQKKIIAELKNVPTKFSSIGAVGVVANKKISKSMEEEMPEAPVADKKYKERTKRVIDLAITIPVVVIVAITMAVTAVAIKLDSPGPVIFKQERIGKDRKVFKIWKFRSMSENSEHTGSGVYSGKGDSRITRVGKFIRATSIDELPQLFNVLRGEMSLIGPRPPLTYHPWSIEEYTEEQLHMFDVRPGVSGWAQIHGRKDVEWYHRIELNNWYVQHVSFALDAKIFLMTIFKVLMNSDNENKCETLKKDNAE